MIGAGTWLLLVGGGYRCGVDIYDPANAGRLTPEFLRGVLDEAWARRDEAQPDVTPLVPGPDAPRSRAEFAGLRCDRCGHARFVSVSFNEGWTRRAQCVPCGAVHRQWTAPGWRAL